MFKSMFSKYLIAFISIILISFLMVSAIVTSMIRSYVTDEKENQLYKTTSSIAETFETMSENEKNTENLSRIVSILLNRDEALEIMFTDEKGTIILSSMAEGSKGENGMRRPISGVFLGKIDMRSFKLTENENHGKFYLHRVIEHYV